MIYTHIRTEKIRNLANPFDELVQEKIESLRDNGNTIIKKSTIIPESFGVIDTFSGTYNKLAVIAGFQLS